MEERRQDDRKIAVLEERVTNWMESTTEYRKDLCRKIDIITSKLGELPCSERKGWYQSMGKQVAFMWLVLGIILTAIVGAGWVGINRTDQVKDITSRIENRVGINTQRVDNLDVIHNIVPR